MGDAPLIVGVSGLRGIVGRSLTPEVAVRFAGAFGSWLVERVGDSPRVLICRDGRRGGGVLLDAAAAGLRGAGCDVLDGGVLMTPSAGVAAVERGCSAALIATASHNPQEWNGLKALLVEEGEAFAPSGELASEIVARFESGGIAWARDPDEIGYRDSDDPDLCMLHAARVFEAVGGSGWDGGGERSWRAVLDSVNASGARGAMKLLGMMGVYGVQLFGDDDGVFPHTPEPTAENLSGAGGLCDAVAGLKADIGFAQDPDADRLAIVDENGRYVGEEYTLALCAESVLSSRGEGEPEAVLVANLSTSRMIDDVAARHGARVVRTAVGEANVVDAMKQLRDAGAEVVLGGEGNGGVIWPGVVLVRDSLSAMALVLGLMARTGRSVSELVARIDSWSAGGEGYAIVKRKVEIPSKAAARPAVEKVAGHYRGRSDAGIDLQDGVRVDFPERGVWVHVRASNTEPIMRLIAEAPTRAEAEEVLGEVERVIAGQGVCTGR